MEKIKTSPLKLKSVKPKESNSLTKSENKSSIMGARRKKSIILTSMCLPGAIWFILLRYLPMAGIVLAFKQYKVYPKNPTFWSNLYHSKWVGFKNFEYLFKTQDALRAVRNTLVYNVIWIAMGLVLAVAFAIILNELRAKVAAKAYQTLMFFPYFLSWVVVSYFVLAFFDPTSGLVTSIRAARGLPKIDWYNMPKYWPWILTFANQWKNVGYSTILYLTAIVGIDRGQYEAAAIDGASWWQQIRYVTLPNLAPMISILLIMNVGKIFNSDFGLFYSVPMNSASLYPATQTIDTYIYNVLTATNNIGQSTAGGFLQNLVGFVCIMAANSIVRKIDEDSGLF